MGLDMYFNKKTYVMNWPHTKPEDRHHIEVTKNGELVTHIHPDRVTMITERIGYWRKANGIHQWFVENVQGGEDDCKEYEVDYPQIQELLDICNKVLATEHLAPSELPTQEGFFFGDQLYDDYYFDDIRETKGFMEAALADIEAGKALGQSVWFTYQSSW